MQFVVLYLTTAVIFLALDAVMLTRVIKPVFQRHLGDALLDSIRLGPAVAFYLFYVGVLVWLVTAPALASGPSARVALNAALLGAAAYGTYEFTNFAALKAWSWQMVAVDLTWGTVLTTVAALGGLWITRAIMG
jgi:uncharacterized membrane protein